MVTIAAITILASTATAHEGGAKHQRRGGCAVRCVVTGDLRRSRGIPPASTHGGAAMIKKMSEEEFGEWVMLLILAKLAGLDTLSKKLTKQFAEEIEEARYGGMEWVKKRSAE